MTEERRLSFGTKQAATAEAEAEFANNRAYVIGVNAYSNGVPPLRTAVTDAERLGKLLADSHGYIVRSFPRDGAPTFAALRRLLHETLPQEVGPDDRVLFYFAGHGIALDGDDGPEGFLVPEDANREDRNSFLAMTELNDALASLPCRHLLLILDCCFAGAFRWSSTRDLSALPSVIHRERYERYIQDPAWQVITSAAYDQTALDVLSGNTIGERIETAEHSPFAAALFRALEGDADLIPRGKDGQPGGDGVITATELYLYLRECVETATVERRVRQTPGLWPLRKHDKGEYILLSPGHELNLPPAPELNYANNPYRGLQSFDEEHRQLFFGRTRIVEQLYGLVKSQPLTVVLGASGTGKSSVVKAGLLPHLRCMDNEDWQILPVIRPGKSPLATLASLALPGEDNAIGEAERLTALRLDENAFAERVKAWADCYQPGARLLLMVDQLEELITLCWDEGEREHFIKSLAAALNALPDRFRLVLTLRSDFEPQFADCPLKSGWKASRYIVPPMTTDELREAIEGPASVRVLYFQPADLVDRLIDEVIQTPGAMPLLSFTLSELYVRYLERRGDDRALTAEDYEQLGGVVGSLRSRARELYDQLDGTSQTDKSDGPNQATMRRIMLRMVSAQGGELARRRVARSELVFPAPEENDRVAAVLRQLSEARLVVEGQEADGEPYVEPAHDALVRSWDKLLAWTRDEQEQLLLRRLLTPAATEWETHQGGTWHDNPRLTLLQRIKDAEFNWLNATESRFISRSVYIRTMRRVIRWSSVATAFVVLSIITYFAVIARIEANRQTANAYWQNATSIRDRDGHSIKAAHNFIRASLAFSAANDETRSLNADLAAQANSQSVIRTFPHSESIVDAAFSKDGRWLATCTGWDNAAWVWDLNTERRLHRFPHSSRVDNVTFGTTGDLLLIEGWDYVCIDSTKQLKTIREFSFRGGGAFSPDDSKIAVWHDPVVTGPFRLMVWERKALEKGSPLWDVEINHKIRGAQFSPDGRRIITWGDDVQLVDVETGVYESAGHPARGALFLSKDRAATWGDDGVLRVISTDVVATKTQIALPSAIKTAAIGKTSDTMLVETDKAVHRLDINNGTSAVILDHPGEIDWSTRFSTDGRHVVIWGGTQAQVWNTDTRSLKLECRHDGNLTGALFSNDGRCVVTFSSDGAARFWDFAADRATTVEHKGGVIGARLAQKSNRVVSWGRDKAVRFWGTTEEESTEATFDGTTTGAVLSNDETKVATWSSGSVAPLVPSADPFSPPSGLASDDVSSDRMLRVWDTATGLVVTELPHDTPVLLAAFNPEGHQVITCSRDAVTFWDHLHSEKPVPTATKVDAKLEGCRFSKDLSCAVVWDLHGELWLWRKKNSQFKPLGRNRRNVYDAVFDRTGTRLMTCHVGWTQLWDVTSGDMLEEYSHGEAVAVHSASFTADGTKVLTCSRDHTARIWSIGKPDSPYRVFSHDRDPSGQSGAFLGGIFDSTNTRVLTWSDDSTSRLWDVASGQQLRVFRIDPSSDRLEKRANWTGGTFSKNDARILTWSIDGTVVLWDSESSAPIGIFRHASEVIDAKMNSAETRLLTCTKDGLAQLWNLKSDNSLHAGDRVLEWEIRSGTELSDSGEYRVLSYEEWTARKNTYDSRRR